MADLKLSAENNHIVTFDGTERIRAVNDMGGTPDTGFIEMIQLSPLIPGFTNTETISATRALLNTDLPVQRLTPSGANRAITFPAFGADNHPFFIVNASDTHSLLMPAGFDNIAPGGSAMFVSDGAAWHVAGTSPTYPLNALSGLKMLRVSGTALTIESGYAVLPDGTLINVASAITKSSLSLSGNSWYHIYLYLNSGAPDVEIVTTAPASPYFGVARTKNGNTSRRYIGSVRTDDSGNLYDFDHNPITNYVAWVTSVFINMRRVLIDGTATTWTAISLANASPVTVSGAMLYVTTPAGAGIFLGTVSVEITSVGVGLRVVTNLPTRNQSIYYRMSAAGSGNIDLLGFFFER